jgi:hypothetical protein
MLKHKIPPNYTDLTPAERLLRIAQAGHETLQRHGDRLRDELDSHPENEPGRPERPKTRKAKSRKRKSKPAPEPVDESKKSPKSKQDSFGQVLAREWLELLQASRELQQRLIEEEKAKSGSRQGTEKPRKKPSRQVKSKSRSRSEKPPENPKRKRGRNQP